VSDVVWTTMITGGTAILTGGLGWLGARQQTHVELLKLKQERQDPGTAENLKFRQELYLRYLASADALYTFPASNNLTALGFAAIFAPFQRVDDEMELFATAAILPSRKELWDVGKTLLGAWDDADGEPSDDAGYEEWVVRKFVEARSSIRDEWHAARSRLVAAIREDVGPGT
jgi:hypothetical protein